MIHLIFTVCLSADPAVCENRTLLFAENISPLTCTLRAQSVLAEWTSEHPAWSIRRWQCAHVKAGETTL